MPQARKKDEGKDEGNDSVDVAADDPQPTGPADPGDVREVEFQQTAPRQEGVEESDEEK